MSKWESIRFFFNWLTCLIKKKKKTFSRKFRILKFWCCSKKNIHQFPNRFGLSICDKNRKCNVNVLFSPVWNECQTLTILTAVCSASSLTFKNNKLCLFCFRKHLIKCSGSQVRFSVLHAENLSTYFYLSQTKIQVYSNFVKNVGYDHLYHNFSVSFRCINARLLNYPQVSNCSLIMKKGTIHIHIITQPCSPDWRAAS